MRENELLSVFLGLIRILKPHDFYFDQILLMVTPEHSVLLGYKNMIFKYLIYFRLFTLENKKCISVICFVIGDSCFMLDHNSHIRIFKYRKSLSGKP